MTETIELFDNLWLKVEGTGLDFLGLKDNQPIKVKDLRELIKNKNPQIDADEEIKKLMVNNHLFEIDEETAIELGGINYKPIKISQLKAEYIGQPVELNCQIVGEQSQKALVIEAKYECPNCSEQYSINYSKEMEKIVFCIVKEPYICKCGRKGKFKIINQHYVDHSVIFVRDILDKQKFSVQRYEPKKIYVVGQELPNSKIIYVKGYVIVEPKTNNISIITNEIKPLKDFVEDFQINSKHKSNFKKYFGNGIDLVEEINPDIVGIKRKTAKKAISKLLHSPCKIPDLEGKKIIRGGLKIVFFGDTKVGKSELAKDCTNKGFYPLGEYCVAETGGRTGFLFTINNDKDTLIWGVLPLNDMGLAVIDGLQALNSEEMAEFREALEQEEVIVNKSIKGNANARTRLIACMNPNKPMNYYLYKCQAISDSFPFSKTPDITRPDLFIPFCQKDVPSDIIQQRNSKDRQIDKNLFLDHVHWVWSRKPEQINYTEAAIKEIKEKSIQLVNDYSLESLPIVHNGVRDVMIRLSVATAAELDSTDETHEKIIVEKYHVDLAYDFYVEVLDMLQLKEYKSDIGGKAKLSENEVAEIVKNLRKNELRLLELIKHGNKGSSELSTMLGVGDRMVKEYYKALKDYGLIETKSGQGVGLTLKGILFIKEVYLGSSEIVKENFTNKNDSEQKLHQFTPKEHTPSEIDVIRKLDKGDGVLTEEIAKNMNLSIGELYPTLEKMSSEGRTYQHKPDRWKVLE